MAFHPITAFKNPVSRPRAIIWTGVVLIALCLFMNVVIGATSSYWFCAEICHAVQDDAIDSYNRSTHSKVSCISCHMPAGGDPVSFLIHKAEALKELPMTFLGTYTEPLNGESEVSLNKVMFPDTQCTQCHNLENRTVTPNPGIIIDHDVHTASGVRCTFCHNRVAHNESGDYMPRLQTPGSDEPPRKHEDYMAMTACYRCHGIEKGSPASGACGACHPKGFDLKPADHKVANFMGQHGTAAMGEVTRIEEAVKHFGVESPTPESKTASVEKLTAEKDEKSHGKFEWPVAPVETINRCYTCHDQKTFCDSCHGMQMPHPSNFTKPAAPGDAKGHPAISKDPKLAEKCVMCHGQNKETAFCSTCHHGTSVKWKYDKAADWTAKQHSAAVGTTGVASCTTRCHTIKFCNDCHANLKSVPVSHQAANFTKPAAPSMTVYGKTPAPVAAGHATAALKSTEQCGVCHGEGGVNSAFCKSCHKLDMPHDANFKKFHSNQDRAICANCHGFKEVCSSCHHIGAGPQTAWMKAHGGSVNTNSSETCLGKCHKQETCVNCHQGQKVIPPSHVDTAKFVKGGGHVELFKADAKNCTFCHAGDPAALQNSDFCKSCHKLDMPHAKGTSAQKFEHKDAFAKGEYKKEVCANCHSQRFCDTCHHKESTAETEWMYYHPTIVHKSGADGCFQCHKEIECSQCHVNLSKRGLLR